MAFQLMDDLLEYTQDEYEWEKSFMQDIKNGVYTAPVIIGLRQSPQFFEDMFSKEHLSKEDARELGRELHKTKAIQESFELAERYTSKA